MQIQCKYNTNTMQVQCKCNGGREGGRWSLGQALPPHMRSSERKVVASEKSVFHAIQCSTRKHKYRAAVEEKYRECSRGEIQSVQRGVIPRSGPAAPHIPSSSLSPLSPLAHWALYLKESCYKYKHKYKYEMVQILYRNRNKMVKVSEPELHPSNWVVATSSKGVKLWRY